MVCRLLRDEFPKPAVGDIRALSEMDVDLLACALFWGTDRRFRPEEVQGLFCGLPLWVHEQAGRIGVNDPMLQSVIVDYVAEDEAG